MSKSEQRRRMFPDRRFQLRITLQIVGMVYFYLALFSVLANLRALRTVILGTDTEQEYVLAVERLRSFVGLMLLPLALTLVCVCLHSLLFSHRLAGPILRLKSVIRQACAGKIPAHVALRRHDYFHDLCEELNGLCDRLRTDMNHCHTLSSRLADAGEALAADGEMTPGARARLLEMANATQELRQVVESYELSMGAPADAGNALEPEAIPAK